MVLLDNLNGPVRGILIRTCQRRHESQMFKSSSSDATFDGQAGITALGGHISINGDVEIIGDVSLSGRIAGSLRCRSLVLERNGELEGFVVCDTIEVAGTVNGQIYANTIILKEGCSVEGEAYHRQLILENGAYFEGKSRRHADPQSLVDESVIEAD